MTTGSSSVGTGFCFTAWLFPTVKSKDEKTAIEKIMSDPFGFQKVIKLISNIGLCFFGKSAFPAMQLRVGHTDAGIDAFGMFSDMKDIYNGKFKAEYDNKNWSGLAWRCSLAVADLGCTVLWIAELSMTSLSQTAQAIGKIRIFGITPLKFVTKMPSLAAISLGACWIGFIFMTVDSFRKIQKENPDMSWWQRFTASKPSNIWANLAYSTSEVALKTMIIVGGASTTLLGGAGIVAAVLGLRAMVYTVPEEKKAKVS